MVFIHLATGFEEVEALTAADLLRRANVETVLISITGQRMVEGAHGFKIETDMIFEEADYSRCEMIVLPGGMPGTKGLEAHSGLCDKIQLRLSDGLKNLKEGEADEFFIAGMGGTLISEILSSSIWVKNSAYHFVFQPQSRAEELREYLFNNGFEIERETAVLEGRRYYIAFSAVFTGKNTPHCYADCFLGKLPKTPEAKKYISLQINRLEKKYNALSSGEEKERLFITLEKLKSFSSED